MWRSITQLHGRVSGLLLGRRTFDTMAAYWPHVTDEDNPVASTMNSLAKYVVSRTRNIAQWRNSTVLVGDVADEVTKLKHHPGNEVGNPPRVASRRGRSPSGWPGPNRSLNDVAPPARLSPA